MWDLPGKNCWTIAGHAQIDRALYLPASWTGDQERRAVAGVPGDEAFATKPELARQMIVRAPGSATTESAPNMKITTPGCRTSSARLICHYAVSHRDELPGGRLGRRYPLSVVVTETRSFPLPGRCPWRLSEQVTGWAIPGRSWNLSGPRESKVPPAPEPRSPCAQTRVYWPSMAWFGVAVR
jgi:DDE superfamily endonuclease